MKRNGLALYQVTVVTTGAVTYHIPMRAPSGELAINRVISQLVDEEKVVKYHQIMRASAQEQV